MVASRDSVVRSCMRVACQGGEIPHRTFRASGRSRALWHPCGEMMVSALQSAPWMYVLMSVRGNSRQLVDLLVSMWL